MKLTAQRIEGFLRKPDPTVIAVLLYGPDRGLVRERADRLVATVVGDVTDPFRVADVAAESLKDDPARLRDEAAALPFSGGRRVVRIREGKDVLMDAVRNLLELGGGGGLVVVEAGDLGPRSPLRQIFESESKAATLPCYADEGDALRRVIEADLTAHGLTIAPEAMDYLTSHLGADRRVTRSELEKLAVYKEGGQIEVDDVLAVVGDAAATSLDTIAYSACGGNIGLLDRALTTAFAEGLSPISLLRAVARHLQRLLEARAALAAGGSADQAMAALRPAVFYRQRASFRAQMDLWDVTLIGEGLLVLTYAELDCKRTGAPQKLLCQRALFRLAELARAPRGKR
jgi:DNA polymerase III subunit delta